MLTWTKVDCKYEYGIYVVALVFCILMVSVSMSYDDYLV